jgi:hypothetical protein
MITAMNRSSMPAPRISGVAGLFLALLVTLGVAACSNDDVDEIIVRHGPVPSPTILAAGDGSSAVGDTRLFHFSAQTDDGQLVLIDWIMTTTAVDEPATGVESRINTGTFSFGDHNNQIVIEGVALYPGTGAVLEVADEVRRVIVGGSGRFAGIGGEVVSVQFEDGSWEHLFRIFE